MEWAPGNILSQTSTVDDDKVVGALDVMKVALKPQIEDIAEEDVDPDRVEVYSSHVFLEIHYFQMTAVVKLASCHSG